MDQTNYINFTDDEQGDEIDIHSSQSSEDSQRHTSGEININPQNSGSSTEKSDGLVIGQAKLNLIKNLLANVKANNDKVIELLSSFGEVSGHDIAQIVKDLSTDKNEADESEESGSNIIEGVFDGEAMIGPDGKEYSVPANYASKSKLVEGDILKLTIRNTGAFVYKQIGPIERKRIVGELEKGTNGQFYVKHEGKKWKVLTASVTYYKGQAGDEAVIFIPKTDDSQWAAIDNIVRSHS